MRDEGSVRRACIAAVIPLLQLCKVEAAHVSVALGPKEVNEKAVSRFLLLTFLLLFL